MKLFKKPTSKEFIPPSESSVGGMRSTIQITLNR